MAVLIDDDYGLAVAAQDLAVFNPSWVNAGGAAGLPTINATTATPRGMRLSGVSGTSGLFRQYIFESPLLSDELEVPFSVYFQSLAQEVNVEVLKSSGGASYTLSVRSNQIVAVISGAGNPGVVYSAPFTASVGIVYNFTLRVESGGVVTFLKESTVLSSTTAPNPLTGTNRVKILMTHTGPSTPQDGIGLRLIKLKIDATGSPSFPQTINVTPAYSESYAVTPTLTTTGFLSPAAVYSESYAVKPTLVPVTYPLDVIPVFSRSYAVKPILSGGPAVLELTPVYSESYVVTPFLATGQVIEPQPAYSEAYAVTPELIPGPVEIEMTPVYSLAYAILPTLAMNLTLNPNAVYSESYARKPTLKSRFPCGTIAPLQDRIRAEVVNGCGSSCSVGALGSSEVVKRW